MVAKLATALVLPLLCTSGSAPPGTSQSAWKRITSLAGDWSLVDPGGESTDLRATYQVVAGGSAVIETLFSGTAEETVTIYHKERNAVSVTQVSARGGPYRLVPGASNDRETLRFEASSAESRPGDLRASAIAVLDDEHVRVEWAFAPGKAALQSRTIELRREAPLAELGSEVARLRVSLESLQKELDRRTKRTLTVKDGDARPRTLLETRTFPPGPGWNVSGVPFRHSLHDETIRIASTFASQGDEGLTVAHYGFEAGPGCRVRFSVLGGDGYVALVEEEKSPPRRIRAIPAFSIDLEGGEYGQILRQVGGGHARAPVAVEWDLSKYAGKSLRLYVVDAVSVHWGQIAVSEFRIQEDAVD